MSERLETLQKARERMVEDREAFAKTLAAPFDRDKAERARVAPGSPFDCAAPSVGAISFAARTEF